MPINSSIYRAVESNIYHVYWRMNSVLPLQPLSPTDLDTHLSFRVVYVCVCPTQTTVPRLQRQLNMQSAFHVKDSRTMAVNRGYGTRDDPSRPLHPRRIVPTLTWTPFCPWTQLQCRFGPWCQSRSISVPPARVVHLPGDCLEQAQTSRMPPY